MNFRSARVQSHLPSLHWCKLEEIIEDEKITDKGAREVQEQVEDGEEVLNPDNANLMKIA